jgi:hypothetical protein
MSVKRLLLGCALCVVSIAAASASEADSQDMAASQHASADCPPPKDNNNGGDVTFIGHEVTPQVGTPSSSNSDGGSRSNSPAPPSGRRLSLGWQSLLPGSIQ